ncbi:MAG: phosphotransferase [Anaerolineaceae bacterium]|nr:phosphotransferase [Anaerolineaceae bacterium]
MTIDFSALNGHQDMLSPGNPDVARLRAEAVQLLTQIDEQEQLHTQKVIPLPAGMWNALYRLEPAGVVAKLSPMENDFEVNFLRQAAALNIPAPKVFAAGHLEHPALPNATYFLMSYIPNSLNGWGAVHNEMSPDTIQQLGHDLGHALAKLHTVHLGYVTRFSTRVETWQTTLTDGFSPDWDNIAPNALFDDKLLPIFKRLLHKTGYFAFRDGSLIHGDLVLTNALVDANTHKLTAILDPAGYAGMPMFDLGYAAVPWDHGFDFSNAMVESYKQNSVQFDSALFYASVLVTAYRHERFHTSAVHESIFRDILPKLDV